MHRGALSRGVCVFKTRERRECFVPFVHILLRHNKKDKLPASLKKEEEIFNCNDHGEYDELRTTMTYA